MTAIVCLVEYSLGGTESLPVVLTRDNFKKIIGESSPILVYFEKESCAACQRISPLLPNVTVALATKEVKVAVGKVNCSQEEELCSDNSIDTFPTLRLFSKDDKSSDYNGLPAFPSLFAWIDKKTSPPLRHVRSKREAYEFVAKGDIGLALVEKERGTIPQNLLDDLVHVAQKFDNITAIHLVDAIEGPDIPVFCAFKGFDDGESCIRAQSADGLQEELESWVAKQIVPVVIPFAKPELATIFFSKVGTKSLFLFSNETNTPLYREFYEASKALDGRFATAHIPMFTEFGKTVYNYMGAPATSKPTVWLVEKTTDSIARYPFKGIIDKESLLQFILLFEENKLEPEMLSQPEPSDQDMEDAFPIHLFVGKSLTSIVFGPHRPSTSYLVLFFTMGCAHTKEFAPIYSALAEELKPLHDRLVFGVIDGTKNEIKGVEVGGFPTVLLWKEGHRKPGEEIDFAEKRNKEGLVKFLREELPKDVVKRMDAILEKNASEGGDKKKEEGEKGGEEDL